MTNQLDNKSDLMHDAKDSLESALSVHREQVQLLEKTL